MYLKALSLLLIGCMVMGAGDFIIQDCVTADACYTYCKDAIIESKTFNVNAYNLTLDYFNRTQTRMDEIESKVSEDRIFITSMSGAILGMIGGFVLTLLLIKVNPPQIKMINKGGLNG